MALSRRVKNLERRIGIGICPACDGRGKYVVSTINEHDPVPAVKGCPLCGEVQHIVVRYVQEQAVATPDVEVSDLGCNKSDK